MSTPAEEMADRLPKPVPTRKKHYDTSAMAMERTRLGLTIAQVSAGTGITVATYHHIETGKQDPKLSQAFIIARFYGIPVESLWKPLPRPREDFIG